MQTAGFNSRIRVRTVCRSSLVIKQPASTPEDLFPLSKLTSGNGNGIVDLPHLETRPGSRRHLPAALAL